SAEPRRSAVAVVSVDTDRALLTRIGAEIGALGWRVKTPPARPDLALAQIAKRAQTLAVLRIASRGEGIELWVAPEVDAEAHSEWIELDRRHPEVGVLRAIESLRARFVELGIEPEAAPAEDPSAADGEPLASEPGSKLNAAESARSHAALQEEGAFETEPPSSLPPRGVELGLGAGALYASRAASLESKLALAIRIVPDPHFVTSLEAWLPLSEVNVASGERSAALRSTLFGATGEYRGRLGRLRWGAGLGCGLGVVQLRGHSSEGFVGLSKTLYAAVPWVRFQSEFPLSPRFALRLQATAGIARPRPVVQLGDVVGDYWGQPMLSATGSLEWAPFAK
ncbi:MAG TPA: hypothetical protein VFQ35_28965, partial [Polyangiaceae bacterium]|nr:hypothetical protein [Polyangiaceae bacterium]